MSDNKEAQTINVKTKKGETGDQAYARYGLSPSLKASHTALETLTGYGKDHCINALANELDDKINKSKQGDLSQADELLISQAHTLDTFFHKMLRTAVKSEYLESFKTYSNLAFKAQNQCRMTLGTLAEVKNPRPYIQNNKAQYQQVNNGDTPSRAEEKSKTTNELLTDGSNDYETMDTRGTPKASSTDKEMETVGTKHGGKD